MLLRIVAPDIGFGFGWNPEDRRLYIVHDQTGVSHEQIAVGVHSPQLARLLAEMWCMGYRSHKREILRNPNGRYVHMLAEGPQTEQAPVEPDDAKVGEG